MRQRMKYARVYERVSYFSDWVRLVSPSSQRSGRLSLVTRECFVVGNIEQALLQLCEIASRKYSTTFSIFDDVKRRAGHIAGDDRQSGRHRFLDHRRPGFLIARQHERVCG